MNDVYKQDDHEQPIVLGGNVQGGEINIPEKLNSLEKRASEVEDNFEKLERRIEKHQTATYWITGIVATVIMGGFAITTFLIGLDYFQNNEGRYEKFIDQIKNYYYREEIDYRLNEIKEDIKQVRDNIETIKRRNSFLK